MGGRQVLFILVVTCAEIAIVMCYFQLCSEDYHWWWRSAALPALPPPPHPWPAGFCPVPSVVRVRTRAKRAHPPHPARAHRATCVRVREGMPDDQR